MEIEPIESTIQLSSLKHRPKQIIQCVNTTSQEQKDLPSLSISDGNRCCSLSQNHKRTPRIIGKRGTRNTEFIHPSSLAYSKQDQLICKLKNLFFFIFIFA